MAAVVAADPFPQAHGSGHMVFFYGASPVPDLIAGCRDVGGEQSGGRTRVFGNDDDKENRRCSH